MRNLQEQVKKHSVTKNCSDLSLSLKIFANSRPPASSFSRSLEQFFLTAGQKNFGNKIPFEEIFEVVRDVINDLRTRREHALRIRITNF